MHGLMSGDWKRSTVSGPQRLQPDAWTAPDLTATAPAPDSTVPALASLSALRSATPSWLLMFGSRLAKPTTSADWYRLGVAQVI
jgi:hypothetical protein